MLQGIAIDGRRVASIVLSLDVLIESVQVGDQSFEKPSLTIHFYDSVRRPLNEGVVGPFNRKQDWERMGRKIDVPVTSREAVIRVGLNGATGKMSIDNVKLTYAPR